MDSKARFSDRVADYVLYRPGYPGELVEILRGLTGLTPDWVIADLGSGTGLSSRPFLENGNVVVGVEPNAEMRRAGEDYLRTYERFRSVNGSAEATSLENASVDLVIAGQAFHWFRPEEARHESLRILREPKWAALVWNVRRSDTSAFAQAYEELLERFGTDYSSYRSRRIDPGDLGAFFRGPPEEGRLTNQQIFDFDGLRGRHLSASYVPKAGQPGHDPMMRELRSLFDEHAKDGRVGFDYDTQMFVAVLRQ